MKNFEGVNESNEELQKEDLGKVTTTEFSRDLRKTIEDTVTEPKLADELMEKFGFDSVEDFHDGVAKVRKEGKEFLINEEGKNILGEEFRFISGDFSKQNVATVVDLEGKQKIINSSGETVVEIPDGDNAMVEGPSDGKTVVWDKSIDNMYFFNEDGIVAGRKLDEETGSYYYEELDGKKVNSIANIDPFNSGLAKFQTKDGMAGIINDEGKVLAFYDIKDIKLLGNGLAQYEKGGELITINREGNRVEEVEQ